MFGVLDPLPLRNLYRSLDVFFASKSETQGIVLAEAMAAGVPVVAIDAPGVREIVSDKINGRMLINESVEAFAEAIAWLSLAPWGVTKSIGRSVLSVDQYNAFQTDGLGSQTIRQVWPRNPQLPSARKLHIVAVNFALQASAWRFADFTHLIEFRPDTHPAARRSRSKYSPANPSRTPHAIASTAVRTPKANHQTPRQRVVEDQSFCNPTPSFRGAVRNGEGRVTKWRHY